MQTTEPRQSFEGIQAMRFFAALLVVITHSTFYAHERLGGGGAVWNAGSNGVNIFFVISGFVMVMSSQTLIGAADGWKTFIVRRIVRIVPMYWLATTTKLLTLLLLPAAILHSEVDLQHIISSYLFIPTTNIERQVKPLLSVGWTLYYEMFFYALFSLALYLRTNIYIFLGLILVGLTLLSPLRAADWPPITMFVSPIVLQFYLGMLVALTVLKGIKIGPGPALLLFAVSVVLLLLPENFFPETVETTYTWLEPFTRMAPNTGHLDKSVLAICETGIPAAMLILSTACLEPHVRTRIPRWILILGDASYVLYLFHPLIAPLLPVILNRAGIRNFPLSVLLSIFISLCATTAIHVLVERRVASYFRVKGIKQTISVREAI